MPRKRYRAEEIIHKLRDAKVAFALGKSTVEGCKQRGVAEQTYYRRRREDGGLKVDQAKKLEELEQENTRIKRLLAESELDKAILKEAATGNF